MCLKENVYLTEKLKRVLKKGCVIKLEVKDMIKFFEKFRAEKTLCTFLSPNVLLRGMEYRL